MDLIGSIDPSSLTHQTGTQGWNSNSGPGYYSGSEYVTTPSIGVKNSLSWLLSSSKFWVDTIVEVLPISTPSAPTITHVNTLNSTAIEAKWSSSTGATWYWLNATLSGGSTTHINTTSTTVTLNNYTAGSKYTFSVVAANSTGKSAGSVTKYNYTTNIAPTGLTISSITTTSSTLTVINPSGNFSGYKVYLAPGSTGVYSLYTTTSTTSNSISLSGLTDDTQYLTKLSTRYAVGTNYTGNSNNSTILSWYTLPNPPTGLAISQSVVNDLHLTWTAPTGLTNPVLGYKIERSIDNGNTWITLVSNTGTTTTTYDDTTVATGSVYTYRISVITLAGTSNPTSQVGATVLSSIQLNPTGASYNYLTTVPSITWNTVNRNNTNWDMFIDTSNNGTAVSWYHAKIGNSTIKKILGYGTSSITMTGTPNNETNNAASGGYGFQSNGGWLYMVNTAKSVDHYYIGNGTKKHDFTVANDCRRGIGFDYFMVNQNAQPIWNTYTDGGGLCQTSVTTSSQGNATLGFAAIAASSQLATSTTSTSSFILWNFNNTSGLFNITSAPLCSLYQINNNYSHTILPDTIACDWSMQQTIKRFYSGFQVYKQGNTYSTNATDLLALTDNLSPNTKLLMTVDNNVIGIPNNTPNARFILHTSSGDYLIIMTNTKIYYQLASTVLTALQTGNRAYQDYLFTPFGTSTPLQISFFNATHPVTIFATGINNTENLMGYSQLISGFTYRGTSVSPSIRTVDPQWTNDQTNIPLITTSSSLFQIFLSVSDSPTNAALMVTNPAYTVNSIAGVWTVTLLDASKTAEFDIPSGQCGLVYVADITHQPPAIWNYEGQVCATGTNQKTITYTNTLPLTFFTLQYGVTDSFTPSTNGLTTTFRSNTPGASYTVQIQNSTGAVAQSYAFTLPANATIQTQSYNISSVAKPAILTVAVGGSTIYSAFLGSPISLASVSSFFHQYLNYQGFDFLSFIPIIFAAMFTRNTVGIGMALTVVVIATLSFFSIVVVPETAIYISIFIAIIGMIGYRSLYG